MRSACESGAIAAVGTADTGYSSGNLERSQLKQFDSLNSSVLAIAPPFFPSLLSSSLPPLLQLSFSLNTIWAILGTSSSDTIKSPNMYPIDLVIIIITMIACQLLGARKRSCSQMSTASPLPTPTLQQ